MEGERKKRSVIRRTFTPQFKRDAVRLLSGGKTATEIARDLGIARSLLQRWRDQLTGRAEEAFPGKGRLGSQAQKVRDLEKKLRDVTQERDILKKALAYFADEQK